jgi:tungstate transport system permease protein
MHKFRSCQFFIEIHNTCRNFHEAWVEMDVGAAFSAAMRLMIDLDPGFLGIVGLSLRVTLSAVVIAAVVGMPVGALIALSRFPGRSGVIVIINALMGLPPVVAGLALFLLLSRSGPLGPLGWLFTPMAMIAAQTLLVLPIVIALTRQVVEDLWGEYREHLTSLGMTGVRAIPTLLWDGRFSLTTALLAGFGRASAEVGAVLVVGGNIAGYTRTMTTAIALETSKGDLPLALGLGIVLLALTLAINALAYGASRIGARYAG